VVQVEQILKHGLLIPEPTDLAVVAVEAALELLKVAEREEVQGFSF
jgi:hypothetical protein